MNGSSSPFSISQSTYRARAGRLAGAGPCLLALAALLAPAQRAEAAVTANVVANQLQVLGDAANNQITVRVVAGDATRIEVLDGATVVNTFVRATFATILVDAAGGNDTILMSRANGNFTEVATLLGGTENDTITSGNTNDTLNGGLGDDRLIWNPGEGSDIIEGGDGNDTHEFNGSGGNEVMTATANGLRVSFTRDVGTITMDIGTTENLTVNMNGGNDSFSATGNLAALIKIIVDGGDGDDTILGSNGIDVLIGGAGNDFIDGQQGNDVMFAGAGDDVLQWDPGDGSDTLEGQDGRDRMLFNGSNGDENFTADPNGARVRFTRNLGNIVMDLNQVEVIECVALGGTDTFVATNGLKANGVLSLIVDGGVGIDTITGSDTDDTLRGGDDNDIINGGDGNDILEGGNGIDALNGGNGDDTLTPGPGNETMLGGPGNDTLVWNPGDGNDIVEGEDGVDTMLFNGSNGDEIMAAVPAAPRFTFTRNLGNIVMDAGGTEKLLVNGLGGVDRFDISPGLLTLVDITIDAGAGADIINTVASSIVTVDGNTEVDTINFNALNQLVSQTPTTISIAGLTRVTHTQVENINFNTLLDPLPTLTITSPTADPTTTATTAFITLAGTAADTGGIASVTWTNDRGGSGAAIGTTNWTAPNIPLQAGVNVLTVTAEDTAGNETADVLTVTVTELTYTMAEGATGVFFDTDILLANPNSVDAPVTITFLEGDGTTQALTMTLGPTSRTTIEVDQIPGLENAEVSATVTSTAALPLVVERTMRWDETGYGAHTEKATEGPALTWYFAEGSQGFFDTYVLLANPGATPNTATVTFLLENAAPVVKQFTLDPTSRRTVQANGIPEVVNQSFGIVVTFSQPGVAERAMYFGNPLFNAGHESAGVNAPSTSWFLAEGATGSFFTTFVLLANPGVTDATATVTFLPDTGLAVTKTKVVPAGRRLTLNIAGEDASLANTAVATQVESTQPILVERAQYWPFTPDQWYEAHNSFGSTAVGTKWGLAEGRVGGPEAYQTFILLANAHVSQPAQVRITFLRTNGTTVVKSFTVNPTSRFNVQVNNLPELSNESFGAVIEVTSGPGIFVERALYGDSQGVVFAAGTNALATRLP